MDHRLIEQLLHGIGANTKGSDDHPRNIWRELFSHIQLDRGAQKLQRIRDHLIAAPEEDQPFCSVAAGSQISTFLLERNFLAVQEALRILTYTKMHLHPTALPAALSTLSRQFDVYPYLPQILGPRAMWLASQREEWTWWISANQAIEASDSFGNWWPKYRLRCGQSIQEANESIVGHLKNCSTAEKLKFTKWAQTHVHASFGPLLQEQLPSRSKILQRAVLNATLGLKRHHLSDEVERCVREFMSKALSTKHGHLAFTKSRSALMPGISFKASDVEVFADFFTNPQMRILCLANPRLYLPDRPFHKLALDLVTRESMEQFAQIVICGTGHQRDREHCALLLSAFLDTYPEGNTVALRPAPLLKCLTAKELKGILAALLAKPDRLFEKLSLILTKESPYISRTQSEAILSHIHEGVHYDLPFSESRNLNALLSRLAYKLDPRIFPKLRSLWDSTATYMGVYAKNIESFRNIIEHRYKLLESITASP